MERLRKYISRKENEKFKRYVESHPALVRENGFGLLKWAASTENVEIVRYLLEDKRVRPYARYPLPDDPLVLAIRSGNPNSVEIVLAHGANFAMLQDPPLKIAMKSVKSLNPAFIRYMLDIMVTSGPYEDHRIRGAGSFTYLPTDKIDGMNYLHVLATNSRMVAHEENMEILQILMDAGIRMDEVNASGETPLVTAARSNNLDFLQAAFALNVDFSELYKMAREGKFNAKMNEAIRTMMLPRLRDRFGNIRITMQQPAGNSGLRLPNNIATEIAGYNTGLQLRAPPPPPNAVGGYRASRRASRRSGRRKIESRRSRR